MPRAYTCILLPILIFGTPACELSMQNNDGEHNDSESVSNNEQMPEHRGPIHHSDLHVRATNEHPMLVDHDRNLQVKNSGELIDSQALYPDTGIGCSAFLYEKRNEFIVIDCNGVSYSISREVGTIEPMGWKWEQEPPPEFVGEYVRLEAGEYVLKHRDDPPDIEEIYRYKDPEIQ